METFIPASGHVLLSPLDPPKSNFKLPETDNNRKGKVVAVGANTRFNSGDVMEAPCKVGDIVYHAYQFEGDVLLKGKKHKIVRFEGILGVYEK